MFILLFLLNIILRLPTTPHEIGWDSFAIHTTANTVSEFGSAKWWLNLSSVFGFYPYSYASAVPFLLSGISQLALMEMELTILIFCILIGILSALTAYLMANSIFEDQLFAFIVAFLYSTSSGILYFTTWTVSTRGLFIVLLPLFYYLLLKSRQSVKYMFLLVPLYIFLMAVHKLFFFLAIPVIALLLSGLIFKARIVDYIEDVHPRFQLLLVVAAFSLMLILPLFVPGFIGSGPLSELITTQILEYLRFIGILIVLFVVSLLYLIMKKKKTFGEWFILISLIGFTPFFYVANYGKWFFLSLAFIMIGIGLMNIIYIFLKRSDKSLFVVLSVIIISGLLFSSYFQFINYLENTDDRYMDEETYQVSSWMKGSINNNESAFAGERFFGIRVLSIAEVPMLSGQGFNDISYGFVDPDSLEITRVHSVFSPSFYLYDPYKEANSSSSWKLWAIQTTSFTTPNSYAQRIIKHYGFTYFVDNLRYPNTFSRSIQATESKLYDSGSINVWMLSELP